jgi:hypothetical protein
MDAWRDLEDEIAKAFMGLSPFERFPAVGQKKEIVLC